MSDLAPDFAAKLARTANDPDAFNELVFGTRLHGGQRRYAANANADVNFLLPGNSWGKTEFIAREILRRAWFKESMHETPSTFEDWVGMKWKGLVASYTHPIAKESFDRLDHYRKTRPEVRALISRITLDPPHLELANGSHIDWGSLDGQGRLVEAARRQVIFVDEAGHIPDLSYTFDNILFPRTMGVGGQIHLFGTPKAHSDPYLLEVYEKGKDGADPFYYSQAGSVLENEYWSEVEQRRVFRNPRYVTGWEPCEREGVDCDEPVCRPDMGGHPILTQIGRQVILGHFVIVGGFFFNRFHVQRMFTGEFPDVQWRGDTHFHEDPVEGRLYLGAFDLGGNKARKRRKKGSDPTVGMVLDYTERPWRIVRYDYVEGGAADWEDKYQLMAEVYKTYSMPYLLIDATGQIDSVQEALQSRGVEVEGVQFGGNSSRKFDMLRNLQLCTEMEFGDTRGVIRSPLIPRLKAEMDRYVIPDDHIEQDCVMTLAMVAHYVSQWELPSAVAGDVY